MIKIMGIDPGTRSLGLAALEVSIHKKGPFKLIYADTILGDYNTYGVRADGEHQVFAKGLTRAYSHVFDLIEPNVVGCEDNFLGLNPASFKRLIEVVSYFNIYTTTNKKDTPFKLILPRLGKQIVGADFRGSEKEDVKKGLSKCSFLDLNGFDLDLLSEHAHDAILMSLYVAVQYYKDLGWNVLNGEETNSIGKPDR
ncbi:putative crossover junction endodeoxyribonuclease [Aeromonas phage ZPAH34]|uniref:RuvC-like Holliday junction resolvase n=1 Tax=Aeromonas phage ZPAH34 TaxID=2924888 RepID=UPI0023296B06|nr:RuvC-like Holliday junction resolvase [Aeromonas phage ZPAH34]UOX39580.1 putative crossover junction endodeoxyribonuclease [Aeromonas phage ZPAH34]